MSRCTTNACLAQGHLTPRIAGDTPHDHFHFFPCHTFFYAADAYQETDLAYVKHDEVHHNDDGCTATTAVILGQRLVVGHVGDSRAVLGISGKTIELTQDHKPNRPDERQRIEDVGGTVVHAGTWRVGGVLAVSRSFGNRMLKQYIVAHPELREDTLGPDAKCLVVATDGVWDVVENEEAVELVSRYTDAEAAAKALAALAYDRGSYDNISCVVCLFDFAQQAAEADKAGEAAGGESNGGKGGVRSHDTARNLL